MEELTKAKLNAIAHTIKQTVDESINEIILYSKIFVALPRNERYMWVNMFETDYKNKIPSPGFVPNLYEIGLAYMKWQIYLSLLQDLEGQMLMEQQ